MPNRLADAISPYLRSHAENPVDWREWGPEPFADADARDVPVLVSIGYSTCHWCHVMARESFSDHELADYLNERFVAIKVDREEHPDVDAAYLAAAGAFTQNLGWPLNVFVTPEGRTFYAGTYFPPQPVQGHPAFRQVLEAVTDAWRDRRGEVDSTAAAVADALAATGDPDSSELPSAEVWRGIIEELAGYEDREHGGFGGAPKFPVAPVVSMLLDRGTLGDPDAAALAARTLDAMARSELRDPVEGGFFRYGTRRDWSEPHYERMLYDNALLLDAYSRQREADAPAVAGGVADFLSGVMRLPSGAFASAQDSESTVDGERVEGGYYRLDAAARARQHPPALDEKVLTGWNGLAIDALASAGSRLGRNDWIAAAREAADVLLRRHLRADGSLVRASIGERASTAKATLEDYGMLANGLLSLALATGDATYASSARDLVDATMADADGAPFTVPGGADPVLVSHGLAIEADPSEGAYPSGLSATARAAQRLHLLTAAARYREAAVAAIRRLAPVATRSPIGFGGALAVMGALTAPVSQLVVVAEESERGPGSLASVAHGWDRAGGVAAVVTPEQAEEFAAAGFELFEGRSTVRGHAAAYVCRDFVCRLPITEAEALRDELRGASVSS